MYAACVCADEMDVDDHTVRSKKKSKMSVAIVIVVIVSRSPHLVRAGQPVLAHRASVLAGCSPRNGISNRSEAV